MGGALKVPGLCQELDKDGLTHVLGVLGIFQIGVAQAENGVGVVLRQTLRLLAVIHFTSTPLKRAHIGYD